MPDRAAIERARQELEAAVDELRDQMPSYHEGLDRLAATQAELGFHVEDTARAIADLLPLMALLPDILAANPPPGPVQGLVDDLYELQFHLEPLLRHFEGATAGLLEVQAETLVGQRRLQACLDPAGELDEARDLLSESVPAAEGLAQRLDDQGNLVEEVMHLGSLHAQRVQEAREIVLVEVGGGTLADFFEELWGQDERLGHLCQGWLDWVPRLREEHGVNLQQLHDLAGSVAGVEAARIGLQAITAGPAGDIQMLSAELPLVLFPVRLETRFDASELKVRIYPDTIFADTHDERLAAAEMEAGRAYWEQMWEIPQPEHGPRPHRHERVRLARAAREAEEAAWRGMLAHYSASRAAWIVGAMQPHNLDKRGVDAPEFPEAPQREQQWARGARANLLPHHWVVLAYRGGQQVHRVASNPVQQPLALSPQPAGPPADPASAAAGSQDAGDPVAWMFDFQAALDVGMAVEIGLGRDDLALGFDALIVYGVRSSPAGGDDAGRRELEELLAGHHYTQGLSFVAQGTPTNNTSAAPAGYPAPDADGEESFAVEQAERALDPDSDALRLARALGVEWHILERVSGAEGTSHRSAGAMNSALWTVTLGYYLNRMISPVLSRYSQRYGVPLTPEVAVEDARKHFVEYVRGRGSLPAFRVGWTPYGVLPITSLVRWKPRAADPTAPVLPSTAEQYLDQVLRALYPVWRDQIENVPKIDGHPGDPDRALLEVLGMDASAREVRLRRTLGPQFIGSLSGSLAMNVSALTDRASAITDRMVAVGDPALWNPEVLFMAFSEKAYRFRNPLVAPEPLSEVEGLPSDRNYIEGVRKASIKQLRNYAIGGAKPPQSLLFFMLRHAALREYAIEAWTQLVADERLPDAPTPAERVRLYAELRQQQREALLQEHEFHNIRRERMGHKTVWDALDDAILFEPDMSIDRFDQALQVLEAQPTAELERLFTETLDVCSHRLDAWITSLATRRLERMRVEKGLGCHLGAFGWVEHLRPDRASSYRPVTLPDGRVVRAQTDGGGYVHAPSMDHAAAAAVLRSAYLTAGGEGQLRYAVDLSSARVRSAVWLLDGLRQGQPLAALLGYRLERSLHERRLDRHIQPLRDLYPPVANKPLLGRAEEDAGPASAVAARNVVDGLALRAAWHAGSLRLPAGLTEAAIKAELAALDEAVDAVSDLLLSESVYQGVRGNTAAAAASLDSLARGVRPPDPEVVDQPRGGIPLTHRVAVVLGGELDGARAWAEIRPTPRALAEPYVDAWAGSLLGDPRRVLCRVYGVDADSGEPDPGTEKQVSLADLGLRPLDVLALAEGMVDQAAASELDQRIANLFIPGGADPAPLAIEYARAETWDRGELCTFPEVLELAGALNAVLGSARPLRAADLAEPDSVSAMPAGAPDETVDVEQAARRAGEVMELLRLALDELAAAPHEEMRGKLRRASLFGLPSALAPVPYDELPARAKAAQAAMAERLRQAEEAGSDPAKMVEAIFGQAVPFLPQFWPGDPGRLDMALRIGPELIGEETDAVPRWMQGAARVRPALGRWRRLAQYYQALAPLESRAGMADFDLAQLPPGAYGAWAALPFARGAAPPGGLVSLVLHRPGGPAPDGPWAGFLLDEWVEVIPNEREITGLAFHYDSPGAEAPQAVLIAVPPDDAPQWSEDTLVDSLLETLELAKLRLVDLDLLGEVGQLLPAVLMADNTEGHTVGTDFTNLVIGDPPIA